MKVARLFRVLMPGTPHSRLKGAGSRPVPEFLLKKGASLRGAKTPKSPRAKGAAPHLSGACPPYFTFTIGASMQKIFALLFLCCPLAMGQISTFPSVDYNPVLTFDSFNRNRLISLSAGAHDTASGAKYVVGFSVDMGVAADTITVAQMNSSPGSNLLYIRLPATAANPFYLDIRQVVDSSYVVTTSTKGGRFRLIYRTIPY
jgi:hypothetical protein